MKSLTDEIVVIDIAGNRAVVICENRTKQMELVALGFTQDKINFLKKVNNKLERTDICRALVNMNSLFSSGNGWSPAQLLELYREQRLITTPYRVIHWKGSGEYTITIEKFT
ncbi:hypothetical protein [Massilia sp. DWR3-1-1]|uniref:hypothetical protein n=1 Tax=Massilia sp. DWR3-1-1 TaxID=2804559 RepID=UPI003CEEC5E0